MMVFYNLTTKKKGTTVCNELKHDQKCIGNNPDNIADTRPSLLQLVVQQPSGSALKNHLKHALVSVCLFVTGYCIWFTPFCLYSVYPLSVDSLNFGTPNVCFGQQSIQDAVGFI